MKPGVIVTPVSTPIKAGVQTSAVRTFSERLGQRLQKAAELRIDVMHQVAGQQPKKKPGD